MPDPRLREDQHRARAQRHRIIGNVLADAGDEWAAVPLFYSAHHVIKGALLRDPIWGQVNALQVINQDLIPDDRFTTRHKGRKRPGGGPREWGVNELVLLLYRPAVKHYEHLHQASNSVRYGTGLAHGAVPAVTTALAAIEELESRGDLEAPILWPPSAD